MSTDTSPERPSLGTWIERLLLLAAVAGAAFSLVAYGVIADGRDLWPAPLVEDAERTLSTLLEDPDDDERLGFLARIDLPHDRIAAARLTAVAPSSAPDGTVAGTEDVILTGGHGYFRDLCPDTGCLAVALGRDGRVRQAIPWRADEIWAANITPLVSTEHYPLFQPARDMRVMGVARLADGDLIATFQFTGSFPYGGGIARIAPDGHPRWYRNDHTHHWPGRGAAPGTVIALGTALRTDGVPLAVGHGDYRQWLTCDAGALYEDLVRVLDLDGAVLQEFSVLQTLSQSRFAGLLEDTTADCDPTHLNFADRIGAGFAAAVPGVEAGDWLLSLRNLSALVILSADGQTVRRLYRGSFVQQHAAHALADGSIVLFDNLGGDAEVAPSRVLRLDGVTGQEQRLFPPADLPPPAETGGPLEPAQLFSNKAGQIDISADGRRALVAVTRSGHGFEIDLATGDLLTRLLSVHDVTGIDDFPAVDPQNRPALLTLYGAHYDTALAP